MPKGQSPDYQLIPARVKKNALEYAQKYHASNLEWIERAKHSGEGFFECTLPITMLIPKSAMFANFGGHAEDHIQEWVKFYASTQLFPDVVEYLIQHNSEFFKSMNEYEEKAWRLRILSNQLKKEKEKPTERGRPDPKEAAKLIQECEALVFQMFGTEWRDEENRREWGL